MLDQLLRNVGKNNTSTDNKYLLSGSRSVGKQRVNSRVTIHNVLPPSSPLLNTARQQMSGTDLSLQKGALYGELAMIPPAGNDKTASRCSCQSTKKCTCKRCAATSSCQNCGTSPCQCGTCSPGCSCARCKQKRVSGSISGNWQRYGNQLQVAGVAP